VVPPANHAVVPVRETMPNSLRMGFLLSRGTNGNCAYTAEGSKVQDGTLTGTLSQIRRVPMRFGRMEQWLTVLAVAAVTLAAILVTAGWTLGNPWAVAGLAVIAGIAERSRVRLSDKIEISICLLPTLLAGVLYGPLASMVVWGASMFGGFSREIPSPYLRVAIYSCSRSIAGAFTGLVAFAIAHGSIESTFAAAFVATGAGALVAQTLDVLFASCTLRLRGGRPMDVLRTLAPLVLAAVPLYAPIVGLLAYSYAEISGWTLALFFVPALAAQRLFGMYQDQRRLAEDLAEAYARLEGASLSVAITLVAMVENDQPYTAGHSAAVAIYARDIAERLGLPEEQQRDAHRCGLVHDIGKAGLDSVVNKPGPLTLAEKRIIETHSERGERVLSKSDEFAEMALIVRHHHERWDGQGYPDGIGGEEIPLISRIIAVADAYNAMTSDRPYRDAMPSRVARVRLAQGVETQFDTTVVAAFEAILAVADEDYRVAVRSDFTLVEQDRCAETVSEPQALALGAA
jgi:putative nucleotidyltransferase with HDIG domain